MSRKALGGGRVLGSGKGLSSATLPPPQRPIDHLSPSASSLSLDSQTSTPPSFESQDIASRVSLDHGESRVATAAATASARMVCPICNEEMVTLLQLNRHLDDTHKNLEDERQDEAKDWFKSQMAKARKFQPLAVLNQKLKGLDVFESNAETHFNSSGVTPALAGQRPSVGSPAPTSTPELPARPTQQYIDPDEVVTREHWQKHSAYDTCSEPTCGKRLNSTNGNVNCRHCGKLFCEEHTLYQMKLSRSAQHEPIRGLWCRVCETCYKSRDGYNDHTGFEKDHMSEFSKMRRQMVDKKYLEISRLEKRLTRLTQLLANPPTEVPQAVANTNKRWSLSWVPSDPRKALEQSVVTWQDDTEVARCPYCQQEFTSYTFRRHHCRTCGKVVCADPQTGCSVEIGLNVATSMRFFHCPVSQIRADNAGTNNISTEKPEGGNLAVDVRLCKECKSTLFDKQDFQTELKHKPPDVRAYENLVQFERGIRLLLPKFQRLLTALQDPDKPPSAAELAEASKVRKRLTDSFTQYDVAARRIRDLKSDSPTQLKLQKAIYQQASNFLHLNMLPLKALPKLLKHATPHGRGLASPSGHLSPLSNGPNGRPIPALAAIKYNDLSNDASSVTS